MYSRFETSATVHLARGCKSERIKNDEWINFFFKFSHILFGSKGGKVK